MILAPCIKFIELKIRIKSMKILNRKIVMVMMLLMSTASVTPMHFREELSNKTPDNQDPTNPKLSPNRAALQPVEFVTKTDPTQTLISQNLSHQSKIMPALASQLSLIQDKLAIDNVQDYINKNKTALQSNFERVPDTIINEIAPIYTIGLINNRASTIGFARKVQLTEMKLPVNWKSENAEESTDLQMFVAGVDALQNIQSQKRSPIDLKSYMPIDRSMKDYTKALSLKFPHAPVEILEQYVRAQLETKESGQNTYRWTLFGRVPTSIHTFTPEEIANENVKMPKDTTLESLSSVEKIYGLLTSIESILAKNNEGSVSDLVGIFGSHIAKVAGQTALDLSQPVITPVAAAASAVGEKVNSVTTAVQQTAQAAQQNVEQAVSAIQESVDQRIVQPVTNAARTVSDTTAKTIQAASDYVEQAQTQLQSIQKQRAITADIAQHEPLLNTLLKEATNNPSNNDTSIQEAITYIKTVLSNNEQKLSPDTVQYLQSELIKLAPKQPTITSSLETLITPVAAASAVGENVSPVTTAVEETAQAAQQKVEQAVSAVQESVNQSIVQPVTNAALTVSDATEQTIQAASDYVEQTQTQLQSIQKQRRITADIAQHEPLLNTLLKEATNNPSNNDTSIQEAITYIKTVLSNNEQKLSPDTVQYLQSELRKLDPKKPIIKFPVETFLAQPEETQQPILPTMQTMQTLTDKPIEVYLPVNQPALENNSTPINLLEKESEEVTNNTVIEILAEANTTIPDIETAAEQTQGDSAKLAPLVKEVASIAAQAVKATLQETEEINAIAQEETENLKKDKTSWFYTKYNFTESLSNWLKSFMSRIFSSLRKNKKTATDNANPNATAHTSQMPTPNNQQIVIA